MSTRHTSESWQSRGPAPAPTIPTVAFLRSDEGDGHAVQFGPFTGPPRATRHAAEADADALTAALDPSLAAAQRASALRSDPLLLDRVIGARPLGSRTVAARVLRYVLDGTGATEPAAWEGVEVAPTLDRVATGGAVVADGSGEL